MNFLIDGMLGKLSRFLRIFGYDTVYANDLEKNFNVSPIPDEYLIDYAKKTDRIIITKDYNLFRRYIHKSIYLEGEGVYNYLYQLKKELGLDFKFKISKARCSLCNSDLREIDDKNLIKNLVLENTFNHYNKFYQCLNPECKKVYWNGTHIFDIVSKLKKKLEFEQ